MKVIVTPNKKMPIRGLLAHPFTEEKELDLTEMQIKRVLGYGAKVNVVSLDGIKAEITLVNGELNTDAIKVALDKADIPQGETAHPVESKDPEVINTPVTEPEEVKEQEEEKPVMNNQPQQHMTKAQRKAARRAEAQQRAAEEAAKKEAETLVEEPTETVEEEVAESAPEETETVVDEDTAKDNAEVIEADDNSTEE